MRALGILGGIFVGAAVVLAAAAIVSKRPETRSPSGAEAGPAPRIEVFWSLPGPAKVQPSSHAKVSPPPQVAIRGSELQTETAPVHHPRKRHAAVAEHRSKHRHPHSEVVVSTSVVSEGSAPAVPASKAPSRNELAAVEQRLRHSLSDELYSDFELFLYVSKAVSGPLAQHMYVFRKESNGVLDLLYDWPVSTGRERTEPNGKGLELPTFTPSGYFKLDPNRFFLHHTSSEWHESMPFAMFFDWKNRGTPTGLAIHAATGSSVAKLGTRASAGCIRLAPDAAKTLFTLIRTHYRGLTPRFVVDQRTGTMNRDGNVLHDANGRTEMTEGYKVLVVIENYGGANIVAAMY